MKSTPVDLHSIIHFVNFFILGYFVNDRYTFAFLLGIVWEVFEYYVTRHKGLRRVIRRLSISKKYWDESHCLNPVLDILFNMTGYYSGNYIRHNTIL